VLPAVHFNDDAVRVACEIDNVASNLNLPSEVAAWLWKSVPQMPPQFPFRFSRRGSHLPGEFSLPRRPRAITDGPNARLVFR
jgi:hypothetical protein